MDSMTAILTLLETCWKSSLNPPDKFTLNTVFQHCKGITESDSFNLATVSENTILTILKNTKVSKADGLDNLSGCCLKDGAKVLAKPITVYAISESPLENFLTPAK